MTLEEAAALLAKAGIESPRTEARRLLAHAQQLHPPLEGFEERARAQARPGGSKNPTGFFGEGSVSDLSANGLRQFESFIARRAAREPLAYITGHKEFWSMDFQVGPGVLVPRPETETLIEEALRLFPDRKAPLKIADLGTGSGILLLAALKEFQGATGIGFESSPEAIVWARRSAAREPRAEIRFADWNEAEGPFDLVFSNPPYIASAEIATLMPEVSAHEPWAALDGGTDGLGAYRSLAILLPRILKKGGYALLELGFGQAPAMEPLFRGSGLKLRAFVPDLAGIPRVFVLEKAH